MATGPLRYCEVPLKNSSCRIGLLGGIGPEATGIFYLQLIGKLQASGMVKSNVDFPQIIINSIPAPELLDPSASKELLGPYIKGLKELDACGVDFIVMVCNTIHIYHGMLQAEVKTPILDLKSEVEKELMAKGVKSAVILATPTTIESGLLKAAGVRYQDLTRSELDIIADSIRKFNAGEDKKGQARRVSAVANKYVDIGVETVILGCTEISLMLQGTDIRKIDTMDILSDAALKLAQKA